MIDPCLDLVDELLNIALMSGLIEPWSQELHALLSGPAGPKYLAHYIEGVLDEALSHVIADDHLHAGAVIFFQATLPLPEEGFVQACRQWVGVLIQTPGTWSEQGLLTAEGRTTLIHALDVLQPSETQRQSLINSLPLHIAETLYLPPKWVQMINQSITEDEGFFA